MYLCSPPDAPANDTNCEAINGATGSIARTAAGEPVFQCRMSARVFNGPYGPQTESGWNLQCTTPAPIGPAFVVDTDAGLFGAPPVELRCNAAERCCL